MKKAYCVLFALLLVFPVFGQVADIATVRLEVDSLIQVSRALTGSRDFEKAMEVHTVAEKLVLETFGQESELYGKVCFNHGRIMHFKGDLEEGEKWYIESKNVREKALGKESLDYAWSLNNLANVYQALGKYEQSKALHQQSKNIREKLLGKDHADYAASLNNLAINYFLTGNFEQTEQFFLEALDIRERKLGKENADYAWSLNNLGVLYLNMGNLEKAEALHLEALAIREKILGKEHTDYSASLNNLAVVYKDLLKYEKAETLFLEAIAIKERLTGKENPDYAGDIINLSHLYQLRGEYEKTERLLLEAKDIFENKLKQVEHPFYMTCLEHLGILYSLRKEYSLSESSYRQALALREKTLGKGHQSCEMSHINLALLYWDSNNAESAEYHFQQASHIQKTLVLQGAQHLSEKEMLQYVRIFKRDLSQYYSFTYTQMDASRFAGNCFDQTLFYNGFLLHASNQLRNQALVHPEQAETFNLLKSYQRRLATEYAQPVADRDSANVADLEKQANTIEKELTRKVAGYGDAIRQISWQEVRSALKPGEAALEFIHFNYYTPEITDSVMYAALLLKPGMEHPLFIPLFEEKQLKALLPANQASLSIEQVNELYGIHPLEGKNALYRLLWAPLEAQLADLRTVYYAPSGLLHRLNLAALPVDAQSILSDRYELVALGSTRHLVVGNQHSDTDNRTALIYGDIQFNMDSTAYLPAINAGSNRGNLRFSAAYAPDNPGHNDDWQYLKWSAKEVENVQMVLKQAGMHAEVRKGWQATEESFKQIGQDGSSPRILHLSTHGFFFPDPSGAGAGSPGREEPVFKLSEHPMIRSGLILAGANHAWRTGAPLGKREDGILTAYEISQMDLRNTELVVLSACETGLGHVEGNEGVYGLQRAFKIAGAQYLVMSLWQVPDNQTQELMTVFYQKLLLEKRPARQAMQAAQDEMRRRRYEPFYWAGFVVME
ncbi:MAG: CHAT domain-containing protein [Saprospiraceae bacterium]|nr:CHAT domain-containing protein [Saprospiraceae bacterium]